MISRSARVERHATRADDAYEAATDAADAATEACGAADAAASRARQHERLLAYLRGEVTP